MRPLTETERVAWLWREVVYQAMRDLMLRDEATEGDREAAARWMADDSTGVGSFRWACDMAGLDPAEVRNAVG